MASAVAEIPARLGDILQIHIFAGVPRFPVGGGPVGLDCGYDRNLPLTGKRTELFGNHGALLVEIRSRTGKCSAS